MLISKRDWRIEVAEEVVLGLSSTREQRLLTHMAPTGHSEQLLPVLYGRWPLIFPLKKITQITICSKMHKMVFCYGIEIAYAGLY